MCQSNSPKKKSGGASQTNRKREMNDPSFLGMLMCPYGHALHEEGREADCPACAGLEQMPLLTLNERWQARSELLRALDDDPPPGLVRIEEEDERMHDTEDEDDEDDDNLPPPGLCIVRTVDDEIDSVFGEAMLNWVVQVAGDAQPMSVESR